MIGASGFTRVKNEKGRFHSGQADFTIDGDDRLWPDAAPRTFVQNCVYSRPRTFSMPLDPASTRLLSQPTARTQQRRCEPSKWRSKQMSESLRSNSPRCRYNRVDHAELHSSQAAHRGDNTSDNSDVSKNLLCEHAGIRSLYGAIIV